jgi:hypothetical protein
LTPYRGGTPLAVHPLKPMPIVPVRMPATMRSNLFHDLFN